MYKLYKRTIDKAAVKVHNASRNNRYTCANYSTRLNQQYPYIAKTHVSLGNYIKLLKTNCYTKLPTVQKCKIIYDRNHHTFKGCSEFCYSSTSKKEHHCLRLIVHAGYSVNSCTKNHTLTLLSKWPIFQYSIRQCAQRSKFIPLNLLGMPQHESVLHKSKNYIHKYVIMSTVQ